VNSGGLRARRGLRLVIAVQQFEALDPANSTGARGRFRCRIAANAAARLSGQAAAQQIARHA
jgi:hypothetical protein